VLQRDVEQVFNLLRTSHRAMQGRGPAYSLTGGIKGRAMYTSATIAEWLESRRRTASR